jgi:long-subunit acyl-CoA synthetase (AMP-forming)
VHARSIRLACGLRCHFAASVSEAPSEPPAGVPKTLGECTNATDLTAFLNHLRTRVNSATTIDSDTLLRRAAMTALLPEPQQPSPRFVGICSDNRSEWLITDFACTWNDYVSVGLHPTWPDEEFVHIITHTDMSLIVSHHTQ